MKTFAQFIIEKVSPQKTEKRKLLLAHYRAGYSPDEKKAMHAYTGEAAINEYVHTAIHKDRPRDTFRNGKWSDEEKQSYDSHIKNLDSAISKKSTPQDMHVYAATWFDPSKQPDSVYRSKGYFSTSIDYREAKRFSSGAYVGQRPTRHIAKIRIPQGTHGLYVESHADPEFKHQQEFILPRGTGLRHVRSYDQDGKTIHEMELHPLTENRNNIIEINSMKHRHSYELSEKA